MSKSKQHQRASSLAILVSVFVSIGPIYWAPFLPLPILNAVKIALFALIILIAILRTRSITAFYFPGGKTVFFILAGILLLSLPGYFLSDFTSWIYRIQSILQVILFMYCCGVLAKDNELEITALYAARIFFVFSFASLVAMLTVPNFVSPLNEGLTLENTGFGGSRTGWSPTIAVFLPWAYATQLTTSVISLLIVAAMISNQFIVQGRTGIVAVILTFLCWGIFTRRMKIIFAGGSIIAGIAIFSILNQDQIRIDTQDLSSWEGIDVLSTGRLQQYIYAMDLLIQHPLTGIGVDKFMYGDAAWNLHNEPLKLAIESGVSVLILMLLLMLFAIRRGVRAFRSNNGMKAAAVLTIISANVITLFEPEVFFGSFNKGAFIWLCFAICVTTNRGHRLNATKTEIR